MHVLPSSFITNLWPPWSWLLILTQKGSFQPICKCICSIPTRVRACNHEKPVFFCIWLIHTPGCVMKLHIRWGSAACAHLWKSFTRRKKDICCSCFCPSMLVTVCSWGDGFWGEGSPLCSCGTTEKKKEPLISLLLLWWFSCKPGIAVIKSQGFLLCKREWKILDRLLYSKHCSL